MTRRHLVIVIVVIAAVVGLTAKTSDTSYWTKPAPNTNTGFDKKKYSLSDPSSPWVVVNKQRPLSPKDYVPADLTTPKVATRTGDAKVRQATASALETMFTAAAKNDTPLKISSAYRSYGYQVTLYQGYVKSQGQTIADSQSARPGYSEHQTGMAADLSPLDGSCSVQKCFATTSSGKWLAANAYKFGFIIRYPEGLTPITGYDYEPWHVRYIGGDLANEMHKDGVLTLEQFFDLGAAADY
jgi:D-alanyl-D-alanine carboxypeptidase